jgi:hypothetical protein
MFGNILYWTNMRQFNADTDSHQKSPYGKTIKDQNQGKACESSGSRLANI